MTGIYAIHNIINDKYYIGVSLHIETRWKQHKSLLEKNKHYNPKLQNAYNKYGLEKFEFIVLKECSYVEAFKEEPEYIKQFNSTENGYNITTGGDKGGDEILRKTVYVYDLQGNYLESFISRSEAERQLDCHSIKECCNGQCNRGYSKVRQQWLRFSYIKQDKLSKLQWTSHNAKTVYKLDSNGNILEAFISGRVALINMGASPLSHNLRDAVTSHKPWRGYYWAYAESYDDTWLPYDYNRFMIYDLEGNFIKGYISAQEIADEYKFSLSGIYKALNTTHRIMNILIYDTKEK